MMYDRENGFPLFQREGDFAHHFGGVDRIGRRNQQQLWTLCQGFLNSTVPVLTNLNVESINPHGGPGCTQVLGKAQRELGVFMNVAEESKPNWFQRLHRDRVRWSRRPD